MRKIINEKHFKEIIAKKAFIFFGAFWCGPCQNFKIIWNQFTKNFDNTYYLDIDLLSNITSKEKILSIPTLRFYRNGQFIAQLEKYNEEELKNFLEKYK